MNHQQPTSLPASDLRSVMVQLCNQTNLRIIHLLLRENITISCVVSRKLEISSQLTSKRLKALVSVGLISVEKFFKRKIYRINRDRFADLGISVELLVRDIA